MLIFSTCILRGHGDLNIAVRNYDPFTDMFKQYIPEKLHYKCCCLNGAGEWVPCYADPQQNKLIPDPTQTAKYNIYFISRCV